MHGTDNIKRTYLSRGRYCFHVSPGRLIKTQCVLWDVGTEFVQLIVINLTPEMIKIIRMNRHYNNKEKEKIQEDSPFHQIIINFLKIEIMKKKKMMMM